MHSTLKHITQIPTWALKKGGEEKKGECQVVQMFYNSLILCILVNRILIYHWGVAVDPQKLYKKLYVRK